MSEDMSEDLRERLSRLSGVMDGLRVWRRQLAAVRLPPGPVREFGRGRPIRLNITRVFLLERRTVAQSLSCIEPYGSPPVAESEKNVMSERNVEKYVRKYVLEKNVRRYVKRHDKKLSENMCEEMPGDI